VMILCKGRQEERGTLFIISGQIQVDFVKNYDEWQEIFMETLVTLKVSIVLCPFLRVMEVNTKERIQFKATEMFMRYGIRSVSMDDIALQLGISKKTIYQYFADKDELVDGIVLQDIHRMQEDCLKGFQDSENAVDEIFITMERILEQFRNMNPVLLYDLQKFHFRSYQKFMEHKNKYLLKVVRDNIERGIAEEFYRPEIDVEIISRFRLESMMLAFNIDLFPPNKFNLADVTKEIIEHYLFGLATLKGHKLILKYKEEQFKKVNQNEIISGKAK
jgi:AcrR family transcriptional regulator